MKTNIKLKVTPEQSEAVQKICFANGIQWLISNDIVSFTDVEYLFIEPTRIWCRGSSNHNKGIETAGYTEVDADLFIRTNGTCEESVNIVDNSSNRKSKEDMFKQYGFEAPDFDCTILAKVRDEYVGYIIESGVITALTWTLKGGSYAGLDYYPMYNLTPIKKPWYETCKFPILLNDEDNNLFVLHTVSNFTTDMLDTFKPLSNAEIDQLKQDF